MKQFQTPLQSILKKASLILLSYWGKPIIERKKEAGFVTQADLESEQFLINELGVLMPEADFWAEESGQSGSNNNGYRWVIDPLDGTTNFARHLPYFCISVALTHYDEPIVGAIYQPLQHEFFYAEKGQGATLNGQKLTVSSPESFKQAVIAFGLSYRHSKRLEVIEAAQRVVKKARAVRHFGAVAYDLANVACGRFDGVMFSYLSWWDIAAGMLLVREAGGQVSDFEGKVLKPDFKSCIAGGGLVYDNLHQLVRGEQDS